MSTNEPYGGPRDMKRAKPSVKKAVTPEEKERLKKITTIRGFFKGYMEEANRKMMTPAKGEKSQEPDVMEGHEGYSKNKPESILNEDEIWREIPNAIAERSLTEKVYEKLRISENELTTQEKAWRRGALMETKKVIEDLILSHLSEDLEKYWKLVPLRQGGKASEPMHRLLTSLYPEHNRLILTAIVAKDLSIAARKEGRKGEEHTREVLKKTVNGSRTTVLNLWKEAIDDVLLEKKGDIFLQIHKDAILYDEGNRKKTVKNGPQKQDEQPKEAPEDNQAAKNLGQAPAGPHSNTHKASKTPDTAKAQKEAEDS